MDIRLHYNEYPRTLPHGKHVTKFLKSNNQTLLSPYPEAQPNYLTLALAKHLSVRPENLLITCGSDEALYMIFKTFFTGRKKILRPDITYGYYETMAGSLNFTFKQIPTDEAFNVDIDNYRNCDGIVLANPNAPTGIALPLNKVEQLIKNNPGAIVVVDEAYIEFTDVQSAVTLINKYPNLIVTQTFSKAYPMANMRVGYVISNPQLIKKLSVTKDTSNGLSVTTISHKLAEACLLDYDFYASQRKQLMNTRNHVAKQLNIQTPQTNHILVKVDDAIELQKKFAQQGFIVRHIPIERLKNYLRISIGTFGQMESVLEVLKPHVT